MQAKQMVRIHIERDGGCQSRGSGGVGLPWSRGLERLRMAAAGWVMCHYMAQTFQSERCVIHEGFMSEA